MIIVMDLKTKKENIEAVKERLSTLGFKSHEIWGVERLVIGAVGGNKTAASMGLETMAGVEKVLAIRQPFKLVSREVKKENTVIKIGDIEIGGKEIVVVAGPCAVESEESLLEVAHKVKKSGARILRGGAFKPRTSPYSFQGLEEDGLKMLAKAREETGLLVATELVNPYDLDLLVKYADIIQIGARNMQNFPLLRLVGQQKRPVLLKRGASSTIEEWLMAAEYIMSEGNYNIILCERGIRTFETATRNTLDISSIPLVKNLSHLPVIVDPSHSGGARHLVAPLSKASIAAGCDGLIIEVHHSPPDALCDGAQSLTPVEFTDVMEGLSPIAQAVGRTTSLF